MLIHCSDGSTIQTSFVLITTSVAFIGDNIKKDQGFIRFNVSEAKFEALKIKADSMGTMGKVKKRNP